MTQLTQNVFRAVFPVAAAAVLALAGGCTSETPGVPAEQFRGPGEVTDVDRMSEQQIAAGARTDATVRAYHFNHAGGLNSLGRKKLDNMLDGDDADGVAELVVYVDMPKAADDDAAGKKLADARHDAVAQHLMSRGLTEEHFRLEPGHNPDATFFAVDAKPNDDDDAAGGTGATPAATGGTGFGGGLQSK